MRVLVADDDPVSQRILLATLTHLGHEAAVADDGQAAWERYTAHPTDAVITDWMMPRVDGLELTRRIRARPVDRYTWIVLLTALTGRERWLDGMAAGADDFVTKPLDRAELHARLRVAERVLGLQQEVKQLEGLLPICSYCKRIRDEGDRWSQVEEYVSRRTEAQFTHGICPECYDRRVLPQIEQAGRGTGGRHP
jgi:DNA-binding response OmpR family regulator